MNLIRYQKFPTYVAWVADHVNGCKQALERLEFGTKQTPRTWFYETIKDPAAVIAPVVSKLNAMRDHRDIADWDLAKLAKYAPQGNAAPFKERQHTFQEYFAHLSAPSIIRDPAWIKAKRRAIQLLKFNESGHPVSLEQVTQRGLSEDKYNTSSGFPDFGKRKNPDVLSKAIKDAPNAIKDKFPAVMGSRASMGKTGVDARHIFMGSMAVNIWGQRYQQPLQDFIRKHRVDFFTPWEGWNETQRAISSKTTPSSLFFGADYDKMDQHFNLYHGFECYDVIKHYFSPEHWDELHEIIQYVFTMPIITNLGYVDQPHSMPSGSEWTNFLETMWNFIFKLFLEIKYGFKIIYAMGIGDDQLYILSGNWTTASIDRLIDTVIKEFDNAGLPGNKEKQEVSVARTGFLQRLIVKGYNGFDGSTPCAGVYSLIRNVTSQVFPEFYHNTKLWNADMFALRVIMIAENCVNHPLFKWYVTEYIAKANANILEFARKRDSEIREIQKRAKGIANFLPTYNQEKLDSSIDQFVTLKLLRELT
nr:MAG: RNA-dependent RNA polymerase [Porcine picobirnavirus]